MIRLLKIVAAVILSIISLLLFSLTVQRLILEYNVNGVYFDEESMTIYHEQAVGIYALLAALVLVPTIILWRRVFKYPSKHVSTL